MGENSGMHSMVWRYSVVAVRSDYVVKNTNIHNRQMNRQEILLIYALICNHS